MLRFRITTVTSLLIMLIMGMSVFVSPVVAEPNPTINYQGKLTDSSGLAVADGTYNMRFWLLTSDSIATTSAEWTESLTGSDKVQVTNGLFSVMLGSTTPLSGVDFNQTLYLGVEIGGSGAASWDGEMSPRKILGTVPAAFEAFQLGGVASSSFLRSDVADTADGLITFVGGLLSSASSTISGLTFGTATGTTLNINGESFTDFTGTGLTNTSGVLSVSSSSLNISLEGLTDVSSMTENFGDLLYWTGSEWSDLATSSLKIAVADTTGTLGVTRGGTGITTVTTGDLLYGNGSDSIAALGIGTTGQILQIAGGVPTWAATSSLNIINKDTVITVAASDTPAAELANADYFADGTDDEITIQAALDSVPSTGGTIQLLSGTFNVGTTTYNGDSIRIATSSTRLVGSGRGTIIYVQNGTHSNLASSHYIINVTGAADVEISNLKIDGNKANNLGNKIGVLIDSTSPRSLVRGNYIQNLTVAGVGGFANTKTTVSDNYIYRSGYGFIGASSVNSIISNNIFEENQGAGVLAFGGISNFLISDNQFINNGGGVATSVSFDGSSNRNTVSNNYITATGTASLISIASGATDNAIVGNTLVNPTATTYVTDSGTNTRFAQSDRQTITTDKTRDYNLFSVIGSTTATSAAITQLGTGDIFTLNNASGRALTVLNGGNVGIGSSSPNSKLTVAGFVNIDDRSSNLGGIKLNDIPLVTGSTTLNNFFFANASSSTFTSGATHNYAIGDGALKNLTTGENNFSVGWDALTYNTTGSENTALGSGALSYNTTGSHNIALGASALFSNTIGLGNSAFGSFALSNNATGSNNTALGFDALSANNGTGTIAIGYGAANNAESVDRGIFIGYDIDAFSTTADDVLNIGNLIFGTGVDGTGTTFSTGNIGIGTSSPNAKLTVAGFMNVDDRSSNLGGLKLNDVPLATGSTTLNNFFFANASSTTFTSDSAYNYAIGGGALKNLTTGSGNNAFGYQALFGSSTAGMSGNNNNAFGSPSLLNNTTGGYNNAFGPNSLYDNTSGSYNNAIGFSSLYYNTSGSYNNALGRLALSFNTSGSYNNALGRESLYNNTTGSYNNVFGYQALDSNNGTGTIAIGYRTAENATGVDRGIFIGYDIDAFSTTADDVLNIGNIIFGTGVDGTGTTFSTGNIGIGTSSPYTKLTVAGGIGLTGGLYDVNYQAGTSGQILQTTGTGVDWVSTSSLGFLENPFSTTIDPTELTATDFGSFTCNGTTCAVDTSAVTSAMLLDDAIDFGDISYANTLAANPAFGTGESFFGSTGILFEGTTADNFETLLIPSDPTADRTLTLPNNTGTIAITSSAMTGTFDGNNFASGAITTGDLLYGSGAGSISNLTIGTTGQILQVSGGVPTWTATSSLGIDDTIITVAATDTPATEKASADFIADGTDDEITIQAALDSVPSTGGTVQLLSGTFNVGTTTYATSSIRIATSSTRLIGQGPNTIIKLQNSTLGELYIISIGTVDYITVSNLKVDGNKSNNSVGNQIGIQSETSNYSKISNTVVDSVRSSGIQAVFYYGEISDNIVVNGAVGMGIIGPSNIITNNTIRNNSGIALQFFFASYNIVDGNNILNNTGNAVSVILSGNCTFDANFIQDNGGGSNASIALSSAGNTVFSDNFISATGTAKLLTIDSGSSNTNLAGNQFINPNATDFITDSSATTKYNESDRRTITTNDIKGYNLFSIIGSTTATSAAITQLGTGDIFTLNNASGRALTVFNSGNVSIGTTTEIAPLAIAGGGENTFMGIYKSLVSTNSTKDAYQFGDGTAILMNNTTTTNMFGSYISIQDDSDDPNIVFGLNVTANDGSNNAGLSAGVFSTGKTYGVAGVTTAEANGNAEGAGGFFQTSGTTQGNAIRGYSDSITTASLLSLFQDNSTFAGTGLKMNFGNSGGSFSSTTSKYLDFQNAGSSVFSVSAYGTTTIGTPGATTNYASLLIGYGGICIDNDGTCTVNTAGLINSVSQATGNSDLAEVYFSTTPLEAGEIVTLAGELSVDRAANDSEAPVLGVVSTKPGITLGFDDESLTAGEEGYPIALSGRVPVKLSTENGPIKKGDQLMLSSLPGVAMKAKGVGTVVGLALEDFDDERMYSDTYINQFGDDMVDPIYAPITTDTDPRINDGCYYGSGLDSEGKLCVPLVATSTTGQMAEANQIIERESKEEALQKLREEESNKRRLADGTEVMVGQIIMFVKLSHRWADESQLASLGTLFATTSVETVGENEEETLFDRMISLANSFVDGVLSIFELRADRIEVKDELCVDGVCVNADDLRRMLDTGDGGGSPPAEDVPMPGVESEEDDGVNNVDSGEGGSTEVIGTTEEPVNDELSEPVVVSEEKGPPEPEAVSEEEVSEQEEEPVVSEEIGE